MLRSIVFATSTAILGGLVWSGTAHADPGRGSNVLCYVWANQPTAASYSPSATYSYNAVGRASANVITRSGLGTYSVRCRGVGGGNLFSGSTTWGAGGHVQVTSYGTAATWCKVTSWSTGGADFVAGVNCRAPNGALTDSFFDLLFVW